MILTKLSSNITFMPRPNNKKSLIIISKDTFASLLSLLDVIVSSVNFDITGREKNMHNILAHLHYKIWDIYHNIRLEEILMFIKNSHNNIIKVIEKYPNEELFTKRYHFWTGITSLGSYLTSTTSSRYKWGIKALKKLKKIILTKQSDQ